MKKLREFSQRPFNLVVNLARLGVDQTRRDAGDHVLICGAALQCDSSGPELQSEMDKKSEQKQ